MPPRRLDISATTFGLNSPNSKSEDKMKIEATTMKNPRAPLAELGAVHCTLNHPTPAPPVEPSTVGKHFVAPGAVLRAAAARRAGVEYLRRSSPQLNRTNNHRGQGLK
jgi:hypothetical protein